MPQLPRDLPADFRSKVWDQLYKELFNGPLRAPTSQEMVDGLVARRVTPTGKHEVVTREMFWAPKPSGWLWDRFSGADKKGYDGKEIVWFGIDYAEGYKPVRLPTDEDRAVHSAILAMQRPTRANEL